MSRSTIWWANQNNYEFELDLNKLKVGEIENMNLSYSIENSETEDIFFLGSESFNLTNSYHLIKKFPVPEEAVKGDYVLKAFPVRAV